MVTSATSGSVRRQRTGSPVERVSAGRRIVTATGKSAVIACSAAFAVLACAHPGGNSSAEFSSGLTAESLIVSLDDVRRIADNGDLASPPESDVHKPSHQESRPDVPPPCQAVFGGEATFAGGWRQFRSVQYSGLTRPTISGGGKLYSAVTQAVGIYPDDGSARTAFDRLVPVLKACSALHNKYYDFTVNEEDPFTLALDYSDQYLHDIMSNIVRLESSVLIYVAVGGFPKSDRIARTVVQTITDRKTS